MQILSRTPRRPQSLPIHKEEPTALKDVTVKTFRHEYNGRYLMVVEGLPANLPMLNDLANVIKGALDRYRSMDCKLPDDKDIPTFLRRRK